MRPRRRDRSRRRDGTRMTATVERRARRHAERGPGDRRPPAGGHRARARGERPGRCVGPRGRAAVRGILERFLDPGLHLIAEIKRSLAVRRPHRGRRRGHRRPCPRLPGRRRRRHLGPVRAALVRRIGRRPARGPRVGVDPGPRQGVRRRPAPARAAAARRRGRGAAARGAAPGKAACASSSSGRCRSGSSRSWRRTTSASCDSPSTPTPA